MCLVNQITNSQFESNGRLRISIMTSSLKMTSKNVEEEDDILAVLFVFDDIKEIGLLDIKLIKLFKF